MNPLEDPDYVPEHPPVDGKIPDVVSKWGKESQLRWFQRFGKELRDPPDRTDLYVESEYHPNWCCRACLCELEDNYLGGGVMADGWCCCRDQRIAK